MQPLRYDLHTLTGAYALDALDDSPERHRFTRHLSHCQSCTSEVRGLREVATSLALAAAMQPPPALRERVMTAVRQTRQLPPEVHRDARPRPAPRWQPRLAAAVAAATFAAVAIVIAVVLGVRLVGADHQLSRAQARAQAITTVLSAPDARIVTQQTARGGITVVVASAQHELVVTTRGMRRLPASEVYQLWLMGPPGTRSAGLMPAAVSGRAGPLLASGLVPGDKLGVTVEPAGGTKLPTTKPIVVLALP